MIFNFLPYSKSVYIYTYPFYISLFQGFPMTLCSSVFSWSHLHFFILVLLFSFNHFFLNDITLLRTCSPNYSSALGFITGVSPPPSPSWNSSTRMAFHLSLLVQETSSIPIFLEIHSAHLFGGLISSNRLKIRMRCRVPHSPSFHCELIC